MTAYTESTHLNEMTVTLTAITNTILTSKPQHRLVCFYFLKYLIARAYNKQILADWCILFYCILCIQSNIQSIEQTSRITERNEISESQNGNVMLISQWFKKKSN